MRESFRALGRLLAEGVGHAVTGAEGGTRYLRPPGAVEEAAFLLTCTRCGDCVRACPREAIHLLPPTAGAAVGTPYIDPAERACDLCGRCMPACGPGALLTVLDPRRVRMGLAEVDPARCWAHQGQICDLCYQRCPFPGEALRMVEGKPAILREGCTGCGLCVEACVTSPPAVQIRPEN